MKNKTRFAPSPTGELHLGHAYSALCAYDWARANNGEFLLRIEDTDMGRCRPEFTQQIYEDLQWLGIEWQMPVRIQSQHFDQYNALITKLDKMGVLYRCFKTRKEMEDAALSAPHGFRDGIDGLRIESRISHAEEQERIKNGEIFAIRLSSKRAMEIIGDKDLYFHDEIQGRIKVDPFLNGDIIIARKDSKASYHLCAVNDDSFSNISHIIRGEDLLISTHIQVVLQKLLGFETPIYRHHKLILDENGKRFAKRDKAMTLKSLRENGNSAQDIRKLIGLDKNHIIG
jgi:glutamyl-Q tRNA(Asp) synthetase